MVVVGAVVCGTFAGGLVGGGLVARELVAGGVAGADAGDVATPGSADGAEVVGGAPVVPPAGRLAAGPAPAGGVEVAADVRGAVVVVDTVARGDVVPGVVAPDDAQAAARSPPAATSAIDPTTFLMRSFLPVRGVARGADDAASITDYRRGARIVHPEPGPTRANCARSGTSGTARGADDRRWRPITASRLGRPAPSPTMTSAMAASATLNS